MRLCHHMRMPHTNMLSHLVRLDKDAFLDEVSSLYENASHMRLPHYVGLSHHMRLPFQLRLGHHMRHSHHKAVLTIWSYEDWSWIFLQQLSKINCPVGSINLVRQACLPCLPCLPCLQLFSCLRTWVIFKIAATCFQNVQFWLNKIQKFCLLWL